MPFFLASLASLVALLVVAALVLRTASRSRASRDPRANWATEGSLPLWFTLPDGGTLSVPPGEGRWLLGSEGDPAVVGAAPRHALVRIFGGMRSADLTPLEGCRVKLNGVRVRAATELFEGARLNLGAVELVVHLGWRPDPEDARIGSVLAGEQLWVRIAEARYLSKEHTIDIVEPSVDVDAYRARLQQAQALCRGMSRVRSLAPGALVIEEREPPPSRSSLAPGSVFSLCVALAPLHRAGLGHGGLARAVLLYPGTLRLHPVAPTGSVADDLAALRAHLPPEFGELAGTDAASLAVALLEREAQLGAQVTALEVTRCSACGALAALRAPSSSTMFDGVRPDGTAFGGRTDERRTECLACAHVDSELTTERW